MSITLMIIISTAIISILTFKNMEWFNKLKFNAFQIVHKKEYYRLITHGMVHADYKHFAFNMITLWFFGERVESLFISLFPMGRVVYILFYLFAIGIASIPSVIKHKNDHWYNSVGASGAVSAVLFASILLSPTSTIMIFPIPFPIPAIIYGVAYLAYSFYQSKYATDNINHDAHFVGAIFGIVFPLVLRPEIFTLFLKQLGI